MCMITKRFIYLLGKSTDTRKNSSLFEYRCCPCSGGVCNMNNTALRQSYIKIAAHLSTAAVPAQEVCVCMITTRLI